MNAQELGCRSERWSAWKPYRWQPAAVFSLFAIGFWGAAVYIRGIPVADRFEDVRAHFDLWAALIGALGGYALAASACFAVWLAGLLRLFERVRAATAASWVATVLFVGGAVLASLFLAGAGGPESVDRALARQTRPITVFAGMCMAPGLIALMALRSLATDDLNWAEPGACRLRLLIRLRTELRRLLATLGAFLALLVVATGMRRQALLALDPGTSIPAEQVLLYGLLFVVMLGLFYVGASSAIDGRAQQLLDEFSSVPDPAEPALSDRLRRRNDLAGLILGGGSWRSFETTVVIAAPLLTALISSATGG